jgi:hypothetical protein
MAHKTQREHVFDYILINQGSTISAVQEAFYYGRPGADSSSVCLSKSQVINFVRDLRKSHQVSLSEDYRLYAITKAYVPPRRRSAVDLPQHTPPQTPEQAVDTILSTLNIQTAAILRHKLNEMFQ